MIPDPSLFASWEDWARALRASMETAPAEIAFTRATRLGLGNLPKAAEEGVLLYVPNAPDAAAIYYSDGSQYLPLASRSWVSGQLTDYGVAEDFQTFSDTGITSTSWVNVTGATGFDMPGTPDGVRKYKAFLHAIIDGSSGTASGEAHLGIFVGPNGTVADTLVAASLCECFSGGASTIEPMTIVGKEFTPGASDTKWGIAAKVSGGSLQFDILQTADEESYAWIMEQHVA